MKGVHRKGHQRASCLLCQSILCSLIMSSLQSYCRTSWMLLFFALSLGLSTLFSLVGGLLREPQAPAAVTRYLCIGSWLHPFVGSHYALWKRIDTFSRDLLAFKPFTLHGVINKSLSSIACGPDCQVLCFGAMSPLFFLCKFSASDIWQVPLCCMEFRVIISSDNLRQPSAFSS